VGSIGILSDPVPVGTHHSPFAASTPTPRPWRLGQLRELGEGGFEVLGDPGGDHPRRREDRVVDPKFPGDPGP